MISTSSVYLLYLSCVASSGCANSVHWLWDYGIIKKKKNKDYIIGLIIIKL